MFCPECEKGLSFDEANMLNEGIKCTECGTIVPYSQLKKWAIEKVAHCKWLDREVELLEDSEKQVKERIAEAKSELENLEKNLQSLDKTLSLKKGELKRLEQKLEQIK